MIKAPHLIQVRNMAEVSDLHLISSPTYQEEFLQLCQICFHIAVPRELCQDLSDHVWQERGQRHRPKVLHSTCKGNPALLTTRKRQAKNV